MNNHIQFGIISNQKLVSRIFWWSILALVIVIFGFIPEGMALSSMGGNLTLIQGYSVVQRIQYYVKLIGGPIISIALLKLVCDVLYKILKRVDPEDGTKKG